MIAFRSNKQSKPKLAVDSKGFPGKPAIVQETVSSQERIRERAYQLYESRGREPGLNEQDWLRAEREILTRAR
jgi:Protein of unknown function (DUF2934)